MADQERPLADYERLLPWLILAATAGFLIFFGVLKLIV